MEALDPGVTVHGDNFVAGDNIFDDAIKKMKEWVEKKAVKEINKQLADRIPSQIPLNKPITFPVHTEYEFMGKKDLDLEVTVMLHNLNGVDKTRISEAKATPGSLKDMAMTVVVTGSVQGVYLDGSAEAKIVHGPLDGKGFTGNFDTKIDFSASVETTLKVELGCNTGKKILGFDRKGAKIVVADAIVKSIDLNIHDTHLWVDITVMGKTWTPSFADQAQGALNAQKQMINDQLAEQIGALKGQSSECMGFP